MTLVWAVVAGVVIGLVLGALGGGGAILTIPVLTYAFRLGMHEATTASLVIVGVSAIVGALTHARAGRLDWVRGLVFALAGAAGAVGGSIVSRGLDGRWLQAAFAVLLVVVALLMLRPRPGTTSEGPANLRDARTLAATTAAGLGVGVLTGFFGVGGGFAIVPALVLVLGLSMPVAVATSLLVIAVNSAAALVTKLSIGVDLDWPLVLTFTAATMAGSVAGARVAGKLPAARLKQAFALLLLAVAAFMLLTVVPGLVG